MMLFPGKVQDLLRNDLPVITKSLVTCHFLSVYILFLSGFSFTNIHDSQDSRGRGRLFL